MFPLGLTTPDFYCSSFLLPLQREYAQNRHLSKADIALALLGCQALLPE